MNANIDITNALPFLLGIGGSGVLVVFLAQAIKRLFGLSSGHIIHLMVVAVSVALAGAQYVLQLKHLPVEVLGISSATVYGVSQFVYNEAPRLLSLLQRVQISFNDPNAQQPLAPVTAAHAAIEPAVAPVAPVAPAAVPADAASQEFNA